MKRVTLQLFACIIVISTYSQSKFATIAGPNKKLIVKEAEAHPAQMGYYTDDQTTGLRTYDNAIIGNTWYDSQTVNYGNVMQRIWAYPDGAVGATWQCSGEGGVPDRGTGYNYYNGTEWDDPILHLGTATRTGWPSYAPWGPNGEIIAHYEYIAGSGPIRFFKREIKGQGDWIETELINPNNVSLVWHSMITSGENNEYIHLLAYTYDNPYEGQDNALLYYRSSDGAETWEVAGVIIDGLGADYFPNIKSLSYAWANPVGNTLAFTYGFFEYGGWLFKSYDNGDNWERIDVMETPFDPFNPPVNTGDVPCGIGTSAVALDSEGMAHIVFPRMVKIWVEGEVNFYPYTDGLIYWNETMPVLDTAIISSYTMQYLEDGGNLIGWVMASSPYEMPAGQPNYANGLCGFPQLSIDADDDLFVASSTLAPDYSNGEFFFRHILVNSSWDGGTTWVGQQDLNTDLQYIFSECAYPVMAPVIDDYLHIVFQEDPLPGMYEWLNNHAAVENRMMAMKLDKSLFVGVPEDDRQSSIELSQVFPNPVNAFATLNVKLDKTSSIIVNIVTLTGQVVKTSNEGVYNAGKAAIRLDVSDLAPGVYYCVINVDQERMARKIVVR
jgi:hypothetical protein